jgi:deazaflavin-dependent oxidoreductase (nitroreductase family)
MTDGPEYKAPDVTLVGAPHVKLYQETNGQQGYIWNGVPILLLTTVGRKSGLERTSALIYGTDGDDFLVVASQGGAPEHPFWYRNILEKPQVKLQVRDQHFSATAHTASDEERPRLWDIVRGVWPNYDVYVTRTTRIIPVVVLRPDGGREGT